MNPSNGQEALLHSKAARLLLLFKKENEDLVFAVWRLPDTAER
jgi:hypothetical protein